MYLYMRCFRGCTMTKEYPPLPRDLYALGEMLLREEAHSGESAEAVADFPADGFQVISPPYHLRLEGFALHVFVAESPEGRYVCWHDELPIDLYPQIVLPHHPYTAKETALFAAENVRSYLSDLIKAANVRMPGVITQTVPFRQDFYGVVRFEPLELHPNERCAHDLVRAVLSTPHEFNLLVPKRSKGPSTEF